LRRKVDESDDESENTADFEKRVTGMQERDMEEADDSPGWAKEMEGQRNLTPQERMAKMKDEHAQREAKLAHELEE